MTPTPQEASDPRDDYVPLGTDAAGCHHVYRTTDETVHVVDGGGRFHVEDVGDRPVEEWLHYVSERRGWAHQEFGLGIAGLVERAVEC